jgi:PGF-CTERM protein
MIALAGFILTLIPAAFAAGGTISGKVAYPANTTLTMDYNKTVDVTVLTIYAMNTNTNFVNSTHPALDGTYSVHVPENGRYRIFISPTEVIDATDFENLKLAQYPDMGERVYFIDVSGDLKNQDINYYGPGKYVPPNSITIGSPTPSTATVTPKPTSGFAIVLALVGLVGAFALVSRRK